MELIKQIKDAENQAKEIVEQARKDAVALAEQARRDHDEQLLKAQKVRQQAIEDAVAQAQEQTQSQVDALTEQGREEIEAVKQAARGKMESLYRRDCFAAGAELSLTEFQHFFKIYDDQSPFLGYNSFQDDRQTTAKWECVNGNCRNEKSDDRDPPQRV